MNVADITPALMVKNEEYWIYYVLRDLLLNFPLVILLDTGSDDLTVEVARRTAKTLPGGNLSLLEEDYGSDANKIGNGRNALRQLVKTKWMFLVDGDEIWTQPQLDRLLASEIEEDKKVVMCGSHNLEDVEGRLMARTHDIANKDILFTPDITWSRTDYPFEAYGLSNDLPMEVVQYLPATEVFCYHVRHTLRSSKDGDAFFRKEKYAYFPYDKGHHYLDVGWLDRNGAKPLIKNPYLD